LWFKKKDQIRGISSHILFSTLAKTEVIYPKNVRAQVAMDFTLNE
jgi:hypothetical protein